MAWIDPKKVPKRVLANGKQVPCIGMGTFGSDRFTPEQISNAVAGAIRCGYRLFDCASVYGNEAIKLQNLYVYCQFITRLEEP